MGRNAKDRVELVIGEKLSLLVQNDEIRKGLDKLQK